MKKRNLFLTPLLLLQLLSTACHYNNYRTRTVKVNNESVKLKIEYCGEIIFSDDETAIEAIEPDGYVKYRRNDQRFIAESDADGNITYKVYVGSNFKNTLKFKK
jgi:hypothetical protein